MDQEIHLFTIFISCKVIVLSLCLLFKQCYGKNGALWLQLLHLYAVVGWAELIEGHFSQFCTLHLA